MKTVKETSGLNNSKLCPPPPPSDRRYGDSEHYKSRTRRTF